MQPREQPPKVTGEYFGVDLRSLALMRILGSLVILADLLLRLRDLSALYGIGSVYPPQIMANGDLIPPPWPFLPYLVEHVSYFPLLVFIVAFIGACFLLVGYKTRFASVITWASVVTINAVDPLVLFGADTVISLMLFLGMFLPWGDFFSFDATSRQKRKRVASVWTFALLLQISYIYMFAGLEKSSGPDWLDGTAVFNALSSYLGTHLGTLLLTAPAFLSFLTYAVRIFQLSIFFLVFFPVATDLMRTIALVLLVSMHASFALFLNVALFSASSIAFVSVLTPSAFWDLVGRHVPRFAIGSVASPDKPGRRISIQALFSGAAALCFILTISLWDVAELPGSPIASLLHTPYADVVEMLDISQDWDIFAPTTPQAYVWNMVVGTTQDGSQVNAFDPSAPLYATKPPSTYAAYRDTRWGEYLDELDQERYALYRPYFLAYLCRSWNERAASSSALTNITWVYLWIPIHPADTSTSSEVLAVQTCSEAD